MHQRSRHPEISLEFPKGNANYKPRAQGHLWEGEIYGAWLGVEFIKIATP